MLNLLNFFEETTNETPQSGGWTTWVIMGVLLVAVILMMVIPGRKQKKQAEEMRANLKVGATVTTIGGIVGEIIQMDDQYIYIVTGTEEKPNTMKFVRQAIHSVNKPSSETTTSEQNSEEEIVDEIK